MSVDRKLYSCQFAPNGEDPLHAIRASLSVIHHGESVREAFAPQAFAGTRASEVPILLDHDETKRAGTVVAMVAHKDWHIADFVLDGPYAAQAAAYIERSGKVSPGFHELDKDPISAREPCPMNWYTRARLDEISILPPGAIGWYQGAKVTRISELPKPSPAPRVSDPPAAGKVIDHEPGVLVRRYGIGQVLGVRSSRGEYIVPQGDGSQIIYSSHAEYLRDVEGAA